jgi:peptidoglycan/xylan/chitin deacetylase (PgdA/CDA1 family)
MNKFTVCLTHDVDRVYKSYQYITHDIKKFKVNNLKPLFTKENPYWLFDKIMKIEDKYNVRSTFFFLEETIPFKIFSSKNWKYSLGKYKFSDDAIRAILKELDLDGWEIGLHGSYNSFSNLTLLKLEKTRLEDALGKEIFGIRQHFLRLHIPHTWKNQKKAGFIYDASYGLKNQIGFPNKSYYPFIEKNSKLLIIPLALMDGYLFQQTKNVDDAWRKCLEIIDEAENNNAVLVVLWHQRVFYDPDFPGYTKIYEKIISECKRRNALFKLCREVAEIYNKNSQKNSMQSKKYFLNIIIK